MIALRKDTQSLRERENHVRLSFRRWCASAHTCCRWRHLRMCKQCRCRRPWGWGDECRWGDVPRETWAAGVASAQIVGLGLVSWSFGIANFVLDQRIYLQIPSRTLADSPAQIDLSEWSVLILVGQISAKIDPDHSGLPFLDLVDLCVLAISCVEFCMTAKNRELGTFTTY